MKILHFVIYLNLVWCVDCASKWLLCFCLLKIIKFVKQNNSIVHKHWLSLKKVWSSIDEFHCRNMSLFESSKGSCWRRVRRIHERTVKRLFSLMKIMKTSKKEKSNSMDLIKWTKKEKKNYYLIEFYL
jgi:hypothetical protein